ncbi:MAG: hypothetical protein Q7U91_00880 [Sideroxyarcus sp.]|nr:hypothetical protein [Sideroxyarcus sp.]
MDTSTIVLCDRRWLNLRKTVLLPAALVLAAMIAAMVFALTVILPDGLWDKLPALIVEKLSKLNWGDALLGHLDGLFLFCIILGQILYLKQAQQFERLTLSPDGIRYTSPLPRILKRLKPDWSLAWNEVCKAELGSLNARLNNPEFVLLTLYSAAGKQRIFPVHWVNAGNYSRPAFRFRFALASPARDEIFKSAMASEVVRYISNRLPQLSIEQATGAAEVLTSLEKHPHGRMALGIVALLILYAIADFVAIPYSYVDEPSALLHLFIPAGIVGAILARIWLHKSTLPAAENNGLALLIGMLVAVAMVPGALRINALTDSDGGTTYDYYVTQSRDGVVLRPVIEGMPVIDYFAKKKFWNEFGKDDTYPVRLQKGVLEFYQFDSSIIVDDIRARDKY